MRPVSSRTRRAATAVLTAVVTATLLTGCGSDDDTSPFTPPKGDADDAAALGYPTAATRNTTRTATKDPLVAAAADARAAYPNGSDFSRAKAVTLVDRNDWRAALAATALTAAPTTAPLLYTDGTKLPDVTDKAIAALKPSGSDPFGGAQAVLVGKTARPAGLRTASIEGANPFELARAIDRRTTQARGRTSDRVLVVSADDPEFAIPAAAWLAKSGDPVAFVTSRGIPAATAKQLAAHPKATLYVLGPSKVIRPSVTKLLRKYGTVERLGGVTPAENAVGFARYKDGAFGWNVNQPGHGFLIARQDDTLGAIALAPLAASGLHGPLLLVDGDQGDLTVPVREYLRDVRQGYYPDDPSLDATGVARYNRAWLTGDFTQISAKVQAQIDTLLEVAPVSDSAKGSPDGLPTGAKKAPTPTTAKPTTTAPTPSASPARPGTTTSSGAPTPKAP
ncbi:hypothetical protein [Patulibacter minatonensis]|uniref:hypothetical protein n=1 Tax=Patulibacter minatonensis TaxID=298163 RepID=UPI00047BC92E|nr:hypothetical protein [Patulibacter minatonensis]